MDTDQLQIAGCLFLDEAYALADSSDAFSGEAIRTLLTEVGENKNVMVVMAGYADKMVTNADSLMNADPGLPRRFRTRIHLNDYTPMEIARIAESSANQRFDLTFEDGLLEALATHVEQHHAEDIPIHNGGLAINLTEQAFQRLATRMVDQSDGSTRFDKGASKVLVPSDYQVGIAPVAINSTQDAGAAAEASNSVQLPDMATLLEEIKLSKYLSTFTDADVEAEDLRIISDGQLKELRLPMGARCKLQRWQAEHGAINSQLQGLRSDFARLQVSMPVCL